MNAHQRRLFKRRFWRNVHRFKRPPITLTDNGDGTYAWSMPIEVAPFVMSRVGPIDVPSVNVPAGAYIDRGTLTIESFDEGMRNAIASPYAIPGYGR